MSIALQSQPGYQADKDSTTLVGVPYIRYIYTGMASGRKAIYRRLSENKAIYYVHLPTPRQYNSIIG